MVLMNVLINLSKLMKNQIICIFVVMMSNCFDLKKSEKKFKIAYFD